MSDIVIESTVLLDTNDLFTHQKLLGLCEPTAVVGLRLCMCLRRVMLDAPTVSLEKPMYGISPDFFPCGKRERRRSVTALEAGGNRLLS